MLFCEVGSHEKAWKGGYGGIRMHVLWSDHAWFTLESSSDWARLILWCLSNFAVLVSYFLIPLELCYWRKAIPFQWTSFVGLLFVAFITLCGISHLAMIVIMPTGPWWSIIFVFVPLALISVATVLVLRRLRGSIVLALSAVKKVIDG